MTRPVPAASVNIEEVDYEGMDSDDEHKHMVLDDMGDTVLVNLSVLKTTLQFLVLIHSFFKCTRIGTGRY